MALTAAIVYKLLLPAAVLGGSIFGSKTTQVLRGPATVGGQVAAIVKWGAIAFLASKVLK